jgi:drug/metabolite transporter (DMT)-like permease
MSANPQRARALTMLVLVSLLWGFSFPVLKAIAAIHDQLVPGGGSWFVTAWSVAPRFIVAGAVLALVLRRQIAGLTALEIRQGTGMAFFLALGLFFQVDGLQHTTASVSAFLTQVYVVLIPLYFAVKWRRFPRWIVMAACALVLVGIAILARIDFRDLRLGRGEAETLLGSVFFTGQILWLERPRFAANNAWRMTFVMFAWLAVAFTSLAALLAPSASALIVPWTDAGWLGLTLVLALVCTLFCFTAMNRWQPHITSTEAGLIYSLEPVSVAVLALFLPGLISAITVAGYANEELTWHLVAGGALITAANLMIVLRKPRPPPPGMSVD